MKRISIEGLILGVLIFLGGVISEYYKEYTLSGIARMAPAAMLIGTIFSVMSVFGISPLSLFSADVKNRKVSFGLVRTLLWAIALFTIIQITLPIFGYHQ